MAAQYADGRFSLGEFWMTADRMNNNNVLDAWEVKAEDAYAPPTVPELRRRLARIAEACSITGIPRGRAANVDGRWRCDFPSTAVLRLALRGEELAIPPQIKLEQAKGF